MKPVPPMVPMHLDTRDGIQRRASPFPGWGRAPGEPMRSLAPMTSRAVEAGALEDVGAVIVWRWALMRPAGLVLGGGVGHGVRGVCLVWRGWRRARRGGSG